MSSHLVRGVPLPDAVGGHPALDFCNTRAGWGSATPKEYLTSAHALALWAADAGLAPWPDDAGEHPEGDHAEGDPAGGDQAEGDRAGGGSAEALRRALTLREALYRCALGTAAEADWRHLSREAAAARGASTLVPGPDATAVWVLDGGRSPRTRADAARFALHAAAAAAEHLVTSPLAGCVKACPGTGCGWLFADPRRRRRWCSMAVCGNRAKARRHAERRQDDQLRHELLMDSDRS